MKPGRLLSSIAAFTGASLIVVSAAGSASMPGASTAGGHDDFRIELGAFLDDLGSSVAGMRTDPYLSDALDVAGADVEGSIAAAVDLVEGLSADDLDTIEQALEAAPSVVGLPAAIDDAVEAASDTVAGTQSDLVRPTGFALPGTPTVMSWPSGSALTAQVTVSPAPVTAWDEKATFTDNCVTAGDPAALIVATLVLNQLQSAAYAVVIAIPSVFAAFTAVEIPVPAKIIAAVVYGVALAVYLALAQTTAVAIDCAETRLAFEQANALPVAPSNSVTPPPDTVVRGSSQLTVDVTTEAVGDIGAQVAGIATNVTLVTGQVVILTDRAVDLNTTLSCTTGIPVAPPTVACTESEVDPVPGGDAVARVVDSQTDLQTLAPDVGILRNTQSGILVKANEEIDALAAFEALQIRMEIEANLSTPGFHPVGLFQLPAPWGYLDTVAVIVREMVNQYGQGGAELASADAAFASVQYKQAYTLYQQAYQRATK